MQSPKNAARKLKGVQGRAFEAATVKARVKLASRFAKPHVVGATTGHVRRRSSEGKARDLVVIDCCYCTYLYVPDLVSDSHTQTTCTCILLLLLLVIFQLRIWCFELDLSRQN